MMNGLQIGVRYRKDPKGEWVPVEPIPEQWLLESHFAWFFSPLFVELSHSWWLMSSMGWPFNYREELEDEMVARLVPGEIDWFWAEPDTLLPGYAGLVKDDWNDLYAFGQPMDAVAWLAAQRELPDSQLDRDRHVARTADRVFRNIDRAFWLFFTKPDDEIKAVKQHVAAFPCLYCNEKKVLPD